jgi:hypothetical protein
MGRVMSTLTPALSRREREEGVGLATLLWLEVFLIIQEKNRR